MDYIDLRDVIENKKTDPDTYFAWKRAIKLFGDTIEDLAENEPTMIPRSEWVNYAQELAEDVGAIARKAQWPLSHIDWEAAAEELEMDYNTIEVDGVEYLFRSY